MRKSLLLLCLLTAFLYAPAKDKIKVKVVSSETRSAVAFVDVAVEYHDTIINYKGDKKGRLSFVPSGFPLTVTARATGMEPATYAYMSMPSKTLKIELAPDPSAPRILPRRRVDWSSATPRRLRSTYIVRSTSKK